MKCIKCNETYQDNWNKFCLSQTKRCINCQKKWETFPENDPENKKFEIEYEYTETGSEVIYAKNEAEAREQFGDNYEGEIVDVREIKKT